MEILRCPPIFFLIEKFPSTKKVPDVETSENFDVNVVKNDAPNF